MARKFINQAPDASFELIGVDVFWAASKNREHRRNVLSIFRTLVEFLEEHNLTTGPLLEPGTELDAKFVLRQSQLTDEGNRFYRLVEQPWLRSVDKGGDPTNLDLLEKTLNKLRESGKLNA